MDNVEEIHPLTAAQKGLLYEIMLAETDAVYRTQSRFDIFGTVDAELLRQAFAMLVQRHGMLRSLFLHVGLDEPAVVIQSSVELPWQYTDLATVVTEAQQARLDELALAQQQTPFDLDQAPLLRVQVARLNPEQLHVILDIHHLIFDGWSSVLFFSELQQVYAALRDGQSPQLPAPGRYADFAKAVQALDQTASAAYWQQHLQGFSAPTPLPLCQPRGGQREYATGNTGTVLDAECTAALAEVARQCRVTLNTLIQAAWGLLLSRYADQDDVLFGITLNGRSRWMQEHTHTLGLFANTVPLRMEVDETRPVAAWLSALQATMAAAVELESYPFANIHQQSEVPAGVELFESLLVFQSFPEVEYTGTPALSLAHGRVHENSPLPLTIEVFAGAQIGFLVMYIESRFSAAAIDQIMRHFLRLLTALSRLDNPQKREQALSTLTMLDDSDQQRLLGHTVAHAGEGAPAPQAGAAAVSPMPAAMSQRDNAAGIVERFRQQARRSPDAIALRGPSLYSAETEVSYQQLEQQVQALSAQLREHGIAAGDCVAVCLPRSTDLYVAVLAVLACDAVWLALDAALPPARMQYLLQDSGACLLLVNGDTDASMARLSQTTGCPVASMQSPQHLLNGAGLSRVGNKLPADALYVMYTSGSTGKPKAVIGSRSATLQRLEWMWDAYPFAPDDVCCQKTTLSFVDCIWELFGPLLQGCTTHIIDDDTVRDPGAFLGAIRDRGITRLVLVPSLLDVLLDTGELASKAMQQLRICIVSGEALATALARRFTDALPACRLLNLYGSTEVTADVTCYDCSASVSWRDASDGSTVPIGRAITGSSVFVVDRYQRLMPPGASGQMAVAGASLSLGYLRAPELNRERFVTASFTASRVFLTGDLARHLDDGNLQHLGRADAQIKLHGQRVEPGEIVQALLAHEGVEKAVVSVDDNGRLRAHYCSAPGRTPGSNELQGYLQSLLPPHMVPQQLIKMDVMPLLPNGKIDRRSLPAGTATAESRVTPVRAMTDTETAVANIWQQVLGGEMPGLNDNFVNAGGTSLTGMRFNARLHQKFERMVMPRMLLSANLAQLALQLNPDDVPSQDSGAASANVQMRPLYFDSPAGSLFGVLHLPGDNRGNGRACLICQPIGNEYMRAYRSLHTLATQLAEQGFTVLRFDPYGCGDSTGDSQQIRLPLWQQSITAAEQALRAASGVAVPDVVATRLAAAVVLSVDSLQIDTLFGWDPLWSGADYLHHQRALHLYALADLDRYRYKQRSSQPSELFGYSYDARFIEQLQTLDMTEPPAQTQSGSRGSRANRIVLIDTHSKESAAVATSDSAEVGSVITAGAAQHWLQRYLDVGESGVSPAQRISNIELPEVAAWDHYHEAGALLFAAPVVNRICTELAA